MNDKETKLATVAMGFAVTSAVLAFVLLGVVASTPAEAANSEILFIRDAKGNEDMIAIVMEYDRNNVEFLAGYFNINGVGMDALPAGIQTVKDHDDSTNILGKTTSNDQFVIFYDKDDKTIQWEFWLDGKQFKDKTSARIDLL